MSALVLVALLGVNLGAPLIKEGCSISTDCNNPFQICSNGLCDHKNLFPLSTPDIISPILFMVGIALSNAAGVGGGAISMPILLALLGFSQLEAVSIANFLMFIGAVARIFISWREKHPRFPHKLAVNYDFIIILLPLALVGTLLGVYINQVFPELILSICTVLLFIFVIYKSIVKGINLKKKEKQSIAQGLEQSLIKRATEQRSSHIHTSINSASLQPLSQEAEALIRREGNHCQPKKIAIILSVFSALLVLTLLRGDGTSSVITRCSAVDWVLQVVFLLICFLVVGISGLLLSHENRIRIEAGIPTDLEWTTPAIIKFASISVTIGIISGALGLGGGVVITPLLFSNGQPPSVASLTSVYIFFFTSLSGFIQYILIGSLKYDYALFNGAFVLLGSIIGLWLISKWIQRTNKQSALVFLLAFIVILALSSLVVFQVLKVSAKLNKGENIWEFASFCPS